MPDSKTHPLERSDLDRGPAAATEDALASPLRRRMIDWRPIFLEAFFVVLGVVLALAANEWRQGVSDRRSARTALESIQEELQSNRQLVLASVQYHLALVDTLSAIRRRAAGASDSAQLPDGRVFSQGFVRPAALLSTAWETAAATDVVRHISHDEVLMLARTYEQQRRYATQGDRIGELIYGEIFARGTGGVIRNYANLSSIIAALSFRECELLVGYDQALAQIGEAILPVELPERCRRMTRR
jgi:hypothetical protein